jgi:hypothetical protein
VAVRRVLLQDVGQVATTLIVLLTDVLEVIQHLLVDHPVVHLVVGFEVCDRFGWLKKNPT